MALTISEKNVRLKMAEKEIYSVEELARRSGVTSLSIRKLFQGGAFLSDTLEKLAKALDCSPFDLLDAEGYPAPLVGAPAGWRSGWARSSG